MLGNALTSGNMFEFIAAIIHNRAIIDFQIHGIFGFIIADQWIIL